MFISSFRQHAVSAAVGGAALIVSSGAYAAAATGPACQADAPGGPVTVTATCVDPQFDRPVIDRREQIAAPFPHLRVSGHFAGTAVRFNFYYPQKDQWQGRFFQSVYPMASADAPDATLQFGLQSGAYTVQTNSGGGYRADAAAAKLARTVANDYYGKGDNASGHIYGYVYGGSGGSYVTIGAIENTQGVWDGAVPYVIGGPTSIPSNFFVRALARVVLADKATRIADTMRPGGSGAPEAELDAVERAVFREVSAMGVPVRGWDDYSYLLGLHDAEGLMGFRDTVKSMDPSYAADFWSLPGYLGTEASALGDIVRRARVRQPGVIGAIARDANGTISGFIVNHAALPANAFGLDVTVLDGAGKPVGKVAGAWSSRSAATARAFTLAAGNPAPVVAALRSGAAVRIDNDWSLALTTYHRHQVRRGDGFTSWDQFVSADGQPRYPQRPVNVASNISAGVSGGGTFTGKIHGKVIAISNALDLDAYPWHGNWYAQRVRQALGAGYDDSFRLWVNDHADHLDGAVIASGTRDNQWTRLVNYVGIVQQAVRDVSAWAERGIAPPGSTGLRVENGQVYLAENADTRQGVQPTVLLTADGVDTAHAGAPTLRLRAGQAATLHGTATMPPGAGVVVQAQWSVSGNGAFVPAPLARSAASAWTTSTTVRYAQPGTYYPVLRVSAQRAADAADPFAHVDNLARVRVVVE
ncbi:MAG: hypothetical protein ABW069_05045 [Duganella sp.]